MPSELLKKLVKIFFLINIFLFFAQGSPLTVNAKTTDGKVEKKVELRVTDFGQPVSGGKYNAINVDVLYQKIVEGSFTDRDVSSQAWTKLGDIYSKDDKALKISGTYTIGPGVKNTSSDALYILNKIINDSYNAAMTLNGAGNIIAGGKDSTAITFKAPKVKGEPFTNKEGKGEAKLPLGYTAIFDSDNRLQKIVDITEATKNISLDLSNPDSGMTIKTVDMPKSSLSGTNQYTIESGESIKYVVKIKAAYLKDGANLTIAPQANLTIDDISVPYTQTDYYNPIITPSVYEPSITSISQINDNYDGVITLLGASLVNLPLYNYNIKLDPSEEDVTIEIHAHISPQVNLKRQINFPPSTDTMELTIPINAYQTAKQTFAFKLSLSNGKDNLTGTSPSVTSTGINFVMMDTEKNKLASGAQYLLGKKKGDNYDIYTQTGNWVEVADLSSVSSIEPLVLEGGNIYSLGVSSGMSIPLNTSLFDFNAKRETKTNQSLIKIVGLASSKDYFLYPIKAPEGYDLKQSIIPFTTFNEMNGKNSVGDALTQNYKVNSLIGDYSAGQSEYNVLSVTSDDKVSNYSSLRVLGGIALGVVVVILVLLLILKFT